MKLLEKNLFNIPNQDLIQEFTQIVLPRQQKCLNQCGD